MVDEDAAADRAEAQRSGPELARALLALRREDRDVFLLCTLGELSYAETAAALRLPLGTVATRMCRARGVLAVQLSLGGSQGRDNA